MTTTLHIFYLNTQVANMYFKITWFSFSTNNRLNDKNVFKKFI